MLPDHTNCQWYYHTKDWPNLPSIYLSIYSILLSLDLWVPPSKAGTFFFFNDEMTGFYFSYDTAEKNVKSQPKQNKCMCIITWIPFFFYSQRQWYKVHQLALLSLLSKLLFFASSRQNSNHLIISQAKTTAVTGRPLVSYQIQWAQQLFFGWIHVMGACLTGHLLILSPSSSSAFPYFL